MKIIKRILWVITLIVLTIIALTFFYKDTLVKRFVDNYNKNLNVTIAYKDVDLSIFKRFPHATINIKELSIINKDIATNDTLFTSETVSLAMNIEELFKKKDEKIILKEILIDNANLNLIVTKDGASNFDIHNLNETDKIKDTTNTGFNIDLKKYQITNTNISYKNTLDDTYVNITELNHNGSGDFSTNTTDFITKTTLEKMTATVGNLRYELPSKTNIDANLGINSKNSKITFNEVNISNANLKITKDSSIKSSTKVKPVEAKETDSKFTFDLKKYAFINSAIRYESKNDKIIFDAIGLNHNGNGTFENNEMDLTTKTFAKSISIKVGDVTYLNKAKIDLDAVLGIDFDKLKFILKKNKGKVNDLDLVFDGFVDVNDFNQEMDIKFHSPKAQFKSILSLIPNAYSSNFNDVTANGIAAVNGRINGINSAKEFPKYNIHIKTTDASFKYPNLPKEVQNITFDGAIVSTSTNNDVFLDIKKSKFTIDKDTFEIIGKITKLITNPTVDASFKGTLNLDNLTKAYPIKLDNDLTGVLTANFTTKADQHSINTNQFNKIKTNGTASLKGFTYNGKDIAKPIHIKAASIKFKTNQILLTNFDAKTGESDIKATGKLNNLFAFLFNDKKLKGNFNVSANLFKVSDFLIDETKNNSLSKTSDSKSLKIPAFLDVNTNLTAKKVIYDNLVLEDVSGNMKLKNQTAIISNSKAKMLDGNITFNGNIDTKKEPAIFDLDLNIDKFDIANSFKTLETFQKLVPIAKALKGKYNSSFKIKGFLNDDFIPNINSINGEAFAKLFVKEFDENATSLLNELTSKLKFIDLSKIDLSKLETILKFANGNVAVQPFDLKYKDITMHISGSHGFDKSLKYNLQMDVPAKHLGDKAVNLLSKLTNINKDTIKIPLTTFIGGTITKPNVNVDVKSALKILALKVIEYQKAELLNQVNETVNQTVDDILSNTGIDSIIPPGIDSIINPKDIINGGVKDVLDDLLGGKKKDSVGKN